ncbi:MAG: hypothetical protein ACK56F_25520, partial [bacterium]
FFIFSLKGQVKKFFLPVVFDRFGTFINSPPPPGGGFQPVLDQSKINGKQNFLTCPFKMHKSIQISITICT